MAVELSDWMCQCGHNKSVHRYEWNPYRGVRDTGCGNVNWATHDLKKCKCAAFVSEVDAEKASRAHMVCPCGHHVDEHFWSASGQIQGVCRVSTHGDYPTCGCREYAGPGLSEVTEKEESACG